MCLQGTGEVVRNGVESTTDYSTCQELAQQVDDSWRNQAFTLKFPTEGI
jgi:hypothetical protein